MRTIGMIGGLGPESTIDNYRSIIARYRARRPDGGYPHVVINSLDVELGLKKVGLFGTGFTMRATFYPKELQRARIGVVLPKESEREFIHRKYRSTSVNC